MKKLFLSCSVFFVLNSCFYSSPIRTIPLKRIWYTVDWNKRNEEAAKILQDLIRIKSVRSNELEVALYLQKLLRKEGIPSKIYASKKHPTRANLVAVLEPRRPYINKGIILGNHVDVVEADASEWSVPPFEGRIVNSRIYGRGALDMKGLAVMQLMAFLELKRSEVPIDRQVMFLSLADEESGSMHGARYMIREHADLFKDYEWMLNEGGVATKDVGIPGATIFNIQYAEKGNLWLKLKAKGASGHGSVPVAEYSALNLIRFYEKVLEFDTSIRITDETRTYFYQLGSVASFPTSFFLKNASNPLIRPLLSGTLRKNKHLSAMTSNTKAITGIRTEEGEGYNVLAGETFGKLDIRILPGFDTLEYAEKIREIAKPFGIEVEIFDEIGPDLSPLEDELFQILANVSVSKIPKSVAAPFLSAGKTDNARFRRIGIRCYGLNPAILEAKDTETLHGKDENISLENLKLGSMILFETLYQTMDL
ncbi:M20/M25/M40 family metallo-hydrolase [Leptospira ellisii]|uniref:M20/M25/M40 family metallo-hydrolase n=2 Tax=Leptospira ellisii TaxID=2023197 RepID=A0A2N0B3J3_9LEPT|nr:M20/M25/M40 family metallo-hydrolase [Leptospira ellisii]MDV6234844.1 M20/M25/M40 family metallo-hydrolase [Leptospira ellisii]PJZ91106.1 peptidase [Leptospira ellisii]